MRRLGGESFEQRLEDAEHHETEQYAGGEAPHW
jgi:hypothetical protein